MKIKFLSSCTVSRGVSRTCDSLQTRFGLKTELCRRISFSFFSPLSSSSFFSFFISPPSDTTRLYQPIKAWYQKHYRFRRIQVSGSEDERERKEKKRKKISRSGWNVFGISTGEKKKNLSFWFKRWRCSMEMETKMAINDACRCGQSLNVRNERPSYRINVFVSKAAPVETRVILWPHSVISNLLLLLFVSRNCYFRPRISIFFPDRLPGECFDCFVCAFSNVYDVGV